MRVLVTGGAGYIGSIASVHLTAAGHDIIVVDDLSNGHDWAVLRGTFVHAGLADETAVRQVFRHHAPEAVMHFAARIEVGESVRDPIAFYTNNTANTLKLLAICRNFGVNRFVFSSTAAVYGGTDAALISETHPLQPDSPYGWSKLMSEQAMADLAAASDFRYVALRYFNAAGADPEARLGELHEPESHLIPLILRAAAGRGPSLSIFGRDYATPDGTCIRDFVHVDDLAQAHVSALTYLKAGGASQALNCGYGHGTSVLDVIDTAERVTGHSVPVEDAPRRPGDSPRLVADSTRIRQILNWRPRYDDLDVIVAHAWAWQIEVKRRRLLD